MARQSYSINKVDVGLVTNLPSNQVIWMDGRNISFKPGEVSKTLGKTLITTIDNVPIRAMFPFKGYDNVWRVIACTDTQIYSYTNNFTQKQNITPVVPPSSTATDTWIFGIIGGVSIISNGINPPWKWSNFAAAITPISGIPQICKSFAVINNRLVTGDIVENGYTFPARIRWSDIIKPEGVGWTRDLKLSSGMKDCVSPHTSKDGIDRINAITNIGNKLVGFTERNIWYGNHVEFPEIYSFMPLDQNIGLSARKAFVKTPYGLFFQGGDDFYRITDGMPVSIGFKIRNACFPLLNMSKINTSFCYYKTSKKEVVFAVPLGTATTPDTAFIYQIETDSWTIHDVDYTCHTQYFTDTEILSYDAVGNIQGQILKLGDGYNNNGQPIDSWIQIGAIAFQDLKGNSLEDINKIIYEIWPGMKSQESVNEIMIQVGVADNLHENIKWSPASAYTIGVSRNANFRTMGKWVYLKFYSDTLNSPWAMQSYKCKFDRGSSR